MLHFGVPLGHDPDHGVLRRRGRLFLDYIDNVSNNCQFWAAVAVLFQKRASKPLLSKETP